MIVSYCLTDWISIGIWIVFCLSSSFCAYPSFCKSDFFLIFLRVVALPSFILNSYSKT